MLLVLKSILFIILFLQNHTVYSSTVNKNYRQKRQITQQRQILKRPAINRKNNHKIKQHHHSIQTPIRKKREEYGVFLGMYDYGKKISRDPCRIFFRFYINGEIRKYRLINLKDKFNAFILHNKLQEGYLYKISFLGDIVTDLTFADQLPNFVEGTVTKISRNNIYINNKPYWYNNDNLAKRIASLPGGAVIINQKLSVGSYVQAFIDRKENVNLLFIVHYRKNHTPYIQGEPGVKTLKNYIKTALSPVGTVLYVFGGGWNSAFSSGGSPQSTTIGVPKSCMDFFQKSNKNYVWGNALNSQGKQIKDPQKSYYPYNGYNEYYYAGFDCSSYMGWVLYNILNRTSGKRSMNISSTKVATTYARWKYGLFTRKVFQPKTHRGSKFRPGNVVCVSGHVWICLGTCKDGSILFLHSVPSMSIAGHGGGGIQMSAIGNSKKCDAYRLANYYMRRYYKKWYKRYRPILCSFNKYFNLKHQDAGMFQWNLSGTGLLRDPDNFRNKYPHEILREIYRGK